MESTRELYAYAFKEADPSLSPELLASSLVMVSGYVTVQWQRYALKKNSLPMEDLCLVYWYPNEASSAAHVELSYCVTGKQYCQDARCKNEGCQLKSKAPNQDVDDTLDFISLHFDGDYLKTLEEAPAQALLMQEGQGRSIRQMALGNKARIVLEQIIHHPFEGTMKNIYLHSKALELLLYSSDQFAKKDVEERYGCRFLTEQDDRNKIEDARRILLENLNTPLTIKELARKVAMNECYLKKGFKAMYGTTIYDYFQRERMERARQLLYVNNMSVTEVALQMGYSCISHFSTAFRKYTGIKPCELLNKA